MRRLLVPLVVGALAAGGSACGSDDSSGGGASTTVSSAATSDETTTTTSPATTTSAAATTTTAESTTATIPCEGAGGATDDVTSPMPSGMMLLTDLDAAPLDACVDSVALTFRPDVEEAPGFTLGYEDGPFSEAGSGAPIEVRGSAFLVLRLEPAAIADLSIEFAPLTYEGPRDFEPEGTIHVVQVRLYDAFEGVVGWVIGLDSQQPFTVETGTSPPSITIAIG